MRVTLPHSLPKDEVRQRLRANAHKIGENVPGGMAEVETNWESDDRMAMTIRAMGQDLRGVLEVENDQLVISMTLPIALSFVESMIEGAIKDQGRKLLE